MKKLFTNNTKLLIGLMLVTLLSFGLTTIKSEVGAADISTCLITGGLAYANYDNDGSYGCCKNGYFEQTVDDCCESSGETCEMDTGCKTPHESGNVCNGESFPTVNPN